MRPAFLITHPVCLEHDPGPGHMESALRLRSILDALEAADSLRLIWSEAPLATRDQLVMVHDPDYVDRILGVRPAGGDRVRLDVDTAMSAKSGEAALRAAGAAVMGVDLVGQRLASAAFAAVRPPGHHAEADRAMGFCLFNNVAVAAHHARARWGISRVAVADFDAHHGNGTQAMFASDRNLFYGSTHQSPCYPGTGHEWERGISGNVVNAPLIPRSTGADFRAAWQDTILPALDEFAPELLILSAGFDAHRADPAADLRVEVSDFEWLTVELVRVAARHAEGRIVLGPRRSVCTRKR